MILKNTSDKIYIALPKGRILDEILPLLKSADIKPEDEFFDPQSRSLTFKTNISNIEIIRIRSFDVATFVAFGAAQIGVAGSDVLAEFHYPDIYSLLDLEVGQCRMSLATIKENQEKPDKLQSSHLRIATKYPNVTKKYFAKRNIQAECIKLNGAIELAPKLGMCKYIVDLVSTGKTLKANGMVEVEEIADVSSRLIVNRTAFKTRAEEINSLIKRFERAVKVKKHR